MNTKLRKNSWSAVTPLTDWSEVNWLKIEKYVTKLQQRIYRAESLGQSRKVKKLQRLLLRSRASLLLSIKRVTQLNKGKRTAGVDGMKILSPSERVKLYNSMCEQYLRLHKPQPVRRTYIPKKKGKLRPLGIPIIKDRVWQNIAKLALEPQWEAKFESTSYGFRPKRSIHDAVQAIFNKINGRDNKKLWVFEGDFKGCFDNLNHKFILEQIKTFPAKGIVGKWLNAGYIDNGVFHETNEGTPQGGIISPLLANIALHGIEESIGVKYKYNKPSKTHPEAYISVKSTHTVVRYADDFIILCESEKEANSMYKRLDPYLKERGIELAENKTKVTNIKEGFDFLGFTFRKWKTRKQIVKKGIPSTIEYYKAIVKPSKESIKKAKQDIKEIFLQLNGTNVDALLQKINPVIVGKANNWKHVVSSEVFSDIDNYIWKKIWKFLRRLHPTKRRRWITQRYFRPDISGQSKDKWLLSSPNWKNHYLQQKKFQWIGIVRHELIKFKNSPFDSSLREYFEKRDIKAFNDNNIASRQKLAKRQKFKCSLCGLSLIQGLEGHEVHHKVPRCHGGGDEIKNKLLVHISCHINYHRVFPAKKPIPTTKQKREHRKILAQLRLENEKSME